MFTKKSFLAAVFLLLVSFPAHAGELKFGWNLVNEAGGILDMEFLPDDDYFLVLAGLGDGQLQLRDTETGDLIKYFPLYCASYSQFEFTPDSTRLVMANADTNYLGLYNLEDLSLIKSFSLPQDTIPKWFNKIVVDPVRPYCYVATWGEKGSFPNVITRGQISVYNYETMELVQHLTDFDPWKYECLAISKDGKYLASINNAKAYMKVWDLETMELIINKPLHNKFYNSNPSEYWSNPTRLLFSNINNDIFHFAGGFSIFNSNSGLLKFDIIQNEIIDSTNNYLFTNKFFLFDNEERLINFDGKFGKVINLIQHKIEYEYYSEWREPGGWCHIIYSKNKDLFIGWCGDGFSSGKYDRYSTVEEDDKIETIYPNPTNSIIYLKADCKEFVRSYEVIDINGIALENNSIEGSNLAIDFSLFPNGIYYIRLLCGSNISTYKVVKER